MQFDAYADTLAAVAFFGVTALFIILTFVLEHHWDRYTTSRMRLYSMRGVYVAVSAFLLFFMVSALIALFT